MYGYASYNINPPAIVNDSQPPNVQNALSHASSAPFAFDEDENLGETTPQSPVTPKGTHDLTLHGINSN